MKTSWQTSIQALILDMDGVLWRGDEAIGDLKSIFAQIHELNWRVTFATNNATRTPEQYVSLLSTYKIKVEPWQIITSADAVIKLLINISPAGGPVYIVGEQGLIDSAAEHGFFLSDKQPVAVVVGFDRNLTYEKLRIATLLLHEGLPYIGTNPDVTFPSPQGLIPGAGSILAALNTASDRLPVIAGKPQPTMYQIALERLALHPDQVLVVGDRLETDIAGAQQIGCRTALVLSGVTGAAQAAKWQPPPDLLADDLAEIIELVKNQSA